MLEGKRDLHPGAAQRDIGGLGKQALAIVELEQHLGAVVHPLVAAAVVAGKGHPFGFQLSAG